MSSAWRRRRTAANEGDARLPRRRVGGTGESFWCRFPEPEQLASRLRLVFRDKLDSPGGGEANLASLNAAVGHSPSRRLRIRHPRSRRRRRRPPPPPAAVAAEEPAAPPAELRRPVASRPSPGAGAASSPARSSFAPRIRRRSRRRPRVAVVEAGVGVGREQRQRQLVVVDDPERVLVQLVHRDRQRRVRQVVQVAAERALAELRVLARHQDHLVPGLVDGLGRHADQGAVGVQAGEVPGAQALERDVGLARVAELVAQLAMQRGRELVGLDEAAPPGAANPVVACVMGRMVGPPRRSS